MDRLVPGVRVLWQGEQWVVTDFLDLEIAELRAANGRKRKAQAPVTELSLPSSTPPKGSTHGIDDRQWDKAIAVYTALQPLLEKSKRRRTVEEVEKVALAIGRKRSTVYRYLAQWESNHRISDFLHKPRSDKGGSRLAPAVREIVERVINEFHAREERPQASQTWQRIALACKAAGLTAPARPTVVRLISLRPPRAMTAARYGRKHAREQYEC